MPRKNPVPDREKAICARLREARQRSGLTQSEFAHFAGLDQRAYASYEYSRSCLNYASARKILSAFRNINPVWLAEGTQDPEFVYFVTLPTLGDLGLGPRVLYSVVYDIDLRQKLIQSLSFWPLPGKRDPHFRTGGGTIGRLSAVEILAFFVTRALARLPDENVEDYLNSLIESAWDLAEKLPRDSESLARAREADIRRLQVKARLARESAENNMLTDTQHCERLHAVRTMKQLLAALRRHTDSTGKKTKLAAAMKLPLSTISRYLSGKMEPGGEATLKLLKWVEEQERSSK